jgi:hypothetical protein
MTQQEEKHLEQDTIAIKRKIRPQQDIGLVNFGAPSQ